MTQRSHHVCLVGASLVENITPTLNQGLKPETVVLAYGAGHQEEYKTLKHLLGRRGIKVSGFILKDAWNSGQLKLEFANLLQQYREANLLLNVSGGNRAMQVAAYDIFNDADLGVFCVQLPEDKIIWLNDGAGQAVEIEDRISLKEFFHAFGAEPARIQKQNQSRQQFKQLTDEIIAGIQRYSKPLGVLNYLAYRSKNSLLSPQLEHRQLHDKNLMDLLNLYESHGLLEKESSHIRFDSEDARFFVNGGWLEDHIFNTLLSQRKKWHIQDAAQGMEIRKILQDGHYVKNELDVCFLSNNRLHVVECKTRKFNNTDNPEGHGAEALYKLDTLADVLGGIHGRGMLVSYLPISKWDLKRAQDLDIAVIASTQLHGLDELLDQWISC